MTATRLLALELGLPSGARRGDARVLATRGQMVSTAPASSKQDTLLHASGWSKGDARVRPAGSEETGVRWAPGGSVGAEPLWRVRISKRK